jgi:hypothetical protein
LVGAAGAYFYFQPLAATWAVALIGGFCAVDVNAGVNLAAAKADSNISSARRAAG